MRQSRTTRHEPLGMAALFSFAGAVPDEIYKEAIIMQAKANQSKGEISILYGGVMIEPSWFFNGKSI